MSSLQDQFDMGRIPIKPLAFTNKDMAQKSEFLIDYIGDSPNYHLYIVDPATGNMIDITAHMVREAFGNSITVNIDGEEDPISLHDIINFIYKRFTYPDNPNGFEYNRDKNKLLSTHTKLVLLRDVDQNYYFPVTRSDAVFDENGNTIQDLLNNITRLGFSNDYIKTTVDGQQIFEITYPFMNYRDSGNYIELRVGTTYIDKTRYQIVDTYDENGNAYGAKITFFEDRFEMNRRIDILYIYNVTNALPGTAVFSGGQIANGSIPISKHDKITSDYSVPDSTSLVTAKGLYDLHREFITALNDVSNNSVYTYDTSSDADTINASITSNSVYVTNKYVILYVIANSVKNSMIKIKLTHSGGTTTYEGVSVPNNIRKGSIVRFVVNSSSIKCISGADPKTVVSTYIHRCVDQETEIPYDRAKITFEDNSRTLIYRNGVRLFESIDYSVNKSQAVINLFVRTEEGEIIVFESESITTA